MIAIIAEKPSVAKDIARVVGANEKHEGFISGNGYMVTWALGHLVSLAMPGTYGFSHTTAENLPIIPHPFQLVIRQRKSNKGLTTDPQAAKQLKVIDEVFSQCQSIIVATDAGREGELIFRYIYMYLGYTKPFKRLWISSLTDEAIQKGMAGLKDGREYDSLFAAADCRAKADWLVGINASQALAIASAAGNNSLGRVQTPTLAMICARYHEYRTFVPANYWQLNITLTKGDEFRQFRYVENIKNLKRAEELFASITPSSQAVISKVERKKTFQAPPLLYDLTTLQKECNNYLNLSPQATLDVAQELYEKKFISYPRTGSRYIPDDVMPLIPDLLKKAVAIAEFAEYGKCLNFSKLNRRSVDNGKVTDHHALITTGIMPTHLSEVEQKVYNMITGRMLESFSPRCEKEVLTMEATIEDKLFRSRSAKVTAWGWRFVYCRIEDQEEDESGSNEGKAEFDPSEIVSVSGHNLGKLKTTPKPLFTEATLLTAMETAGKSITDESLRDALKDTGIGTPATRAAIIATLFRREYIERSGRSLIPTEKGLYVYNAVKNLRIADTELSASWEKTLKQIEEKTSSHETFMEAIKVYTRQVTEEVLNLKFSAAAAMSVPCPKCRNGKIVFRNKIAKCNNEECGLLVFRRFLNKELTNEHLQKLFTTGSTPLIRGFHGKKGHDFDAKLSFNDSFNLTFSFPPKKK